MKRRQVLKAIPLAVPSVVIAGCIGSDDSTDFSAYSDEDLIPDNADLDAALPDFEPGEIYDELQGKSITLDPVGDATNGLWLRCQSHEDGDAGQDSYQSSEYYGDQHKDLDFGDSGYYKAHWDGHGGGVAIEFYRGAARGSIRRMYDNTEITKLEEEMPPYYDDLLDDVADHWDDLEADGTD